MKTIILSALAVLALGYAAAFILGMEHESAFEAYSTSSTRVGDPGHNLVGQNWNGLSEGENAAGPRPHAEPNPRDQQRGAS